MNIHKFEFKEDGLKLIAFLSLGLILFLPSMSVPAAAQSTPPKWSISAAACVPNSATTGRDLLINGAGRVSFRPGKTGTIVLLCPLSDMTLQDSAVSTIELSVRRSGLGQAQTLLKEINQVSGRVNDILQVQTNVVNACLSRSTDPANAFYSCTATSRRHVLDFYRNYYYVEIRLFRTSSQRTNEVEVLGVKIY
jgi:hypothetical protein